MPETPEELYQRAKDVLRTPPLDEWETFPFEGEMRPCRWGDGSERPHRWFWDDVLPPLPDEFSPANVEAFAEALS